MFFLNVPQMVENVKEVLHVEKYMHLCNVQFSIGKKHFSKPCLEQHAFRVDLLGVSSDLRSFKLQCFF